MKRLTLDLDDATHQQLKVATVRANVTMRDLLRVLIRDYLTVPEDQRTAVHQAAAELDVTPAPDARSRTDEEDPIP